MQETSSGDEWMAKSQSGRDKEVGGGRDLGLKVAGICGLAALGRQKSMMTQGGDLLHSGLEYEKEGLVRAFSNKSGAQTAA